VTGDFFTASDGAVFAEYDEGIDEAEHSAAG
jgi:hypothetical protein